MKAYCWQFYYQGLLTWLEDHPTAESRITISSTGQQKRLQYNPVDRVQGEVGEKPELHRVAGERVCVFNSLGT